MKNVPLKYRILIVLGVMVLSVVLIFVDMSDLKSPKIKPRTNVNLGLDLRGGSFLVMEVQTAEALQDEANTIAGRIDKDLRERGIFRPELDVPQSPGAPPVQGVYRDGDSSVVVMLPPGAPTDQITTVFDLHASGWSQETVEAGRKYRLTMPARRQSEVRERAIESTLEKLRNRIDPNGVSEMLINRQGGIGAKVADRIVLQLPGVENVARIKAIAQTKAKLEWKEVTYPTPDFVPPSTKEELITIFKGALPPDTEAYPEIRGLGSEGKPVQVWWPLKKVPIVAGSDLRRAWEGQDLDKGWAVHFELSNQAARRFGDFTATHIGKIAAIVLDGKVISAPRIESKITNEGRITGNYTKESAHDFALELSSGALDASVKTIEERTVGPSLGLDSIKKGILASIVGFAAVMLFMVIYYKGSGLNAVLALALNVVILLGAMSGVHATLTLPGIAGLILTVGMAVDSNVLIFERIREELRLGKTVRAAIDAGFGRVFLTILDTHVTTLGSAACLYMYGTGPVRGFAVTLIFGLLASVFTAVFVSRVIYDIILTVRPHPQDLSI